ncbi:hypothetical protein ACVWXO_005652 [Bradyrhizobium sp. LM2.7]
MSKIPDIHWSRRPGKGSRRLRHLGARIAITSVLHTWGSAMTHHPHVHMIVPGGGISLDGERWVACRVGFFLAVRVLSRLFRRLLLEKLIAAQEAGRLVSWFQSIRSLVHTAVRDGRSRYSPQHQCELPANLSVLVDFLHSTMAALVHQMSGPTTCLTE